MGGGAGTPRQADLRGLGTTGDGRSVVLGMGDGSLTTLAIADPAHPGTSSHLAQLPSRSTYNHISIVVQITPRCSDRRESGLEGDYLQNGAPYPKYTLPPLSQTPHLLLNPPQPVQLLHLHGLPEGSP